MPKKKIKTKEERIVEGFLPDVSGAKRTIEKVYKSPRTNQETQIAGIKKRRQYKKGVFKKTPFKKSKFPRKSKTPITPFKPSTISLKEGGYELIITEKPQAAQKIAEALGNSSKKVEKGVAYYRVNREGRELVVGCAVGHLFTLHQKNPGSNIPIFDISWNPNYLVRKSDFTKKYYDVLLALAKKAGSITVATDYDIEGEVIGLNVVRFIAGQKDANRMKFSTLTNAELNKAYEEKTPNINWGHAIAGETRHYLDWFYGINLSRALMNAIKSTGKFKIMSIGRVQGPALNLVVEKEKQIQVFKPTPYWQVFITVKNDHVLELKHTKDLFNKKELDKFKDLKGKIAQASTIKKQEILPPNPPFNLTTLQTEAYKFYGLVPSRTLQIAQSLYLAGLISYPRTSSQKLPASIAYKDILKKVASKYNAQKLIKRNTPVEGKKSDPAHPSIHPTGTFQILSGDDERIYDLIAKRFLSLFCEDAIIDKKKVTAEIDDLKFSALGSEISKKAWMEVYPSKLKETHIPDIEGPVKIINVKTEEKETQPPNRYSPASIISELEKRNLGTKATRANILETLYDRGYVEGKSITATPLGISLINTLKKHSSIIIDERLTRSFEDSMEAIQQAKGDLKAKEDKIIEKAKKTITLIARDFETHEKEIGQELLQANEQLREQQKEQNKIIQCPVCKTGDLAITYSRKTRRSFIACNAYPNCKTTFSLPPDSLIKKTEKICESCNYPMLRSIKKAKRPWIFCFNPECETNKERIEEYRKKKEEENK
ncbi:MAG: DNA topoisomerase I [Nanoarchaeota archaeon]|nr:DNA topoisomerase I [Nanoarchaeota archaeon]